MNYFENLSYKYSHPYADVDKIAKIYLNKKLIFIINLNIKYYLLYKSKGPSSS